MTKEYTKIAKTLSKINIKTKALKKILKAKKNIYKAK